MGLLRLALKGEYFDQIVSGEKTEEYRLVGKYWDRRLKDRKYDGIVLTKGYPALGDEDRTIRRPWKGYVLKTITHPHFGDDPVEVYAIPVNYREEE